MENPFHILVYNCYFTDGECFNAMHESSFRRCLGLLLAINLVVGLAAWRVPAPRPVAPRGAKSQSTLTPLSGALRTLALPVLGAFNVVLMGAFLLATRRRRESRTAAGVEANLDQWPVALASLDGRGRFYHSNAHFRALFGCHDQQEIVLSALTAPEDSARNSALQSNLLSGAPQAWSEERRFFRADGTPFQGRWHGTPFQGRWHGTPQSVSAGRGATATVLIEDISSQRGLEIDLDRARGALHDLYHVIAAESELQAKMQSLMALGCRRFCVETGFIGQVHEAHLKVLCVQTSDERIRRGQLYDMSGAQREGVLARPKGPRGLLHASPDDWRVCPAFALTEGESYLGAPIVVEAEIWGTLNFSDPEARAGFAADDIQFVQLMAQWLGGEIERRQARSALEHQRGQLLKVNAQLESLAVHDGLTGLKNRRAFDEQLKMEWQRARRYQTPLSMLLLDVDKFKHYNDNFGHPAGDEVLKRVAEILADSVRNIDFVARYGGEEFVLLLPNTDRDGAYILADRLRERIEQSRWTLRAVTASFGVATAASLMSEAPELTKSADLALYQSKENGRNRVTHFSDLAPAIEA